MSNRSSNNSTRMGILGVLQLIFLVLKLPGLLTWSWLVVLIPFWISLGTLAIFLICVLIAVLTGYKKRK